MAKALTKIQKAVKLVQKTHDKNGVCLKVIGDVKAQIQSHCKLPSEAAANTYYYLAKGKAFGADQKAA